MDINSFVQNPLKKRLKKRKLTFKIIISMTLITISFTIFLVFTFKMLFKMFEYSKVKSEYNNIVEYNTSLSKKTDELNQMYAAKKTEHTAAEESYDAAMANAPVAYLTFDDGPSDNTLKLLDVLDKYNVKATFFVVYKEGYDDVYREITKRGHVLANHTYSHDYKTIYASPDAFINNILTLDKKLEEITGVPPSKIIRFPGGSNTDFVTKANSALIKTKLAELGYTFYDWNVDSTDASTQTQPQDAILTGVLNGTDLVNTANILMHDTNMKYTTLGAMPQIIEGLKAKGYKFESLDHDSVKIQF